MAVNERTVGWVELETPSGRRVSVNVEFRHSRNEEADRGTIERITSAIARAFPLELSDIEVWVDRES